MSESPYVEEIRNLFKELQRISAASPPTPPLNGAVGWTIETLKQHFDQRLVDQDKAVQAALAAAEKAVSAALVAAERAREAAEANGEKWRANANEWRGAMNDREAKFTLKTELEAETKTLQADLRTVKSLHDSLKERLDKGDGGVEVSKTVRDESRANIGIIIAFVALILSAVLGFVRASTPTSLPPINLVMPSPGVTTTTTQPVPQPLVPR